MYKKSKELTLSFHFILMILNVTYNMLATYNYKLRVGVFSLENYYLFVNLINNPYCKLGPHCCGVIFGYFYMDILAYRRLDED